MQELTENLIPKNDNNSKALTADVKNDIVTREQKDIGSEKIQDLKEKAKLNLKKEAPNDFDDNFNWDETDPWLGADVETGYVEMSEPKHKEKKNEGFYFMYKSKNITKPRVLVTLIGGPGICIIAKAFGRFNPLYVDGENRCLKFNEKNITDQYHLIYLEAPIGSGFSICHKETKVPDFKTLGNNAVEVFKALFKKYPYLEKADYFFNGESFGGLSTPCVSKAMEEQQKINHKGSIIECGVSHPEQVSGYQHQKNLLDEKEMWNNKAHRCCCIGVMSFATCLKRCKCISSASYEDAWFAPWMCPCDSWISSRQSKSKYSKSDKETKMQFARYDPTNINNKPKDGKDMDELILSKDVELVITSDKFAELIGAKKSINRISDGGNMMSIMDKDPKWHSNDIQCKIIKDGKSLLILSGEGDYIVPWKSMWDQLTRNWTFSQKEEFVKQDWIKQKGDAIDGKTKVTYLYKKKGNLEWRRIVDGGHLIVTQCPDLHAATVIEFMDSHYKL